MCCHDRVKAYFSSLAVYCGLGSVSITLSFLLTYSNAPSTECRLTRLDRL